MSAYIVNDNVINRIVGLLWADAVAPERTISYYITKLGYKPLDRPKELARHMHNLNRFAIRERYLQRTAYTHRYKEMWAEDKYQALKDLKCFLYQCSEGRAEKTRLFQALEKTETLLMQELLRETERYKNTKWNKE